MCYRKHYNYPSAVLWLSQSYNSKNILQGCQGNHLVFRDYLAVIFVQFAQDRILNGLTSVSITCIRISMAVSILGRYRVIVATQALRALFPIWKQSILRRDPPSTLHHLGPAVPSRFLLSLLDLCTSYIYKYKVLGFANLLLNLGITTMYGGTIKVRVSWLEHHRYLKKVKSKYAVESTVESGIYLCSLTIAYLYKLCEIVNRIFVYLNKLQCIFDR